MMIRHKNTSPEVTGLITRFSGLSDETLNRGTVSVPMC